MKITENEYRMILARRKRAGVIRWEDRIDTWNGDYGINGFFDGGSATVFNMGGQWLVSVGIDGQSQYDSELSDPLPDEESAKALAESVVNTRMASNLKTAGLQWENQSIDMEAAYSGFDNDKPNFSAFVWNPYALGDNDYYVADIRDDEMGDSVYEEAADTAEQAKALLESVWSEYTS